MRGLASLDLFDFGILLQALCNNLKVGVLVVRSDSREKFLQVDRTRVLRVFTKKPKVSLEKVLWNYRAIEKPELKAAIDAVAASKSGGGLAEHLLASGAVTPQEMRRARLCQMIEEVLEIFYWKNVGFEFHASDSEKVTRDPSLTGVGESVEVESLLLQCTKAIDDIAKFNEVTPSMRDVYELQIDGAGSLEQVVPDPVEREFLLLIDGVRDMREVLRDMRLNRFEALEYFFRFRTRGWLRPKNAFELLMLSENCRRDFSLEKRARVLERVNELGVEGFQVLLPLAETYGEMGARDKAAALFARHARKCLQAADNEGAVKAARRAAALLPGETELREFEIEVLTTAGLNGDASAAHQVLAEMRMGRGDLDGARRGLRKAVRLTPALAPPWRLLGEVYERLGAKNRAAACMRRTATVLAALDDRDGAIESFRRAQTLCPNAFTARYRLAELLQASGRGDLAVQALSEMVDFAAEYPAWTSPQTRIQHLAKVEMRLRECGGFASSAAVQLGRRYAALGESDRAVSALRESAEVLARAGRHRGAVAVLDELLETAPQDHDARRSLARAHVASGDGTRALAHLRRLTGFFMGAARWSEAKDTFSEMLRVDPACPDAHRGLARALLYLGETDAAAEHYHRVGLIYRGYGQPSEAAPYLREAVEKRPADADLLDEYCELLLRGSDRAETLRALAALVELRMAQGAPDHAAIALRKILAIDSRYPGAKTILQEAARQILRLAELSEELTPEEARLAMEQARKAQAALAASTAVDAEFPVPPVAVASGAGPADPA